MKVAVRCGGGGGEGGLTLRCSAGERRVWVERGGGEGAHKMVYSSTFDSVLDEQHGGGGEEAAAALAAAALDAGVAACKDGRAGLCLCLGTDPARRAVLLQALAMHAIPALLSAGRPLHVR